MLGPKASLKLPPLEWVNKGSGNKWSYGPHLAHGRPTGSTDLAAGHFSGSHRNNWNGHS